jgi:hypothetical protein
MAGEGLIAQFLGLTASGERALADAFVLVGLRHAVEPEIRNAARLHHDWCHRHLDALREPAARHGMRRTRAGSRLRRALFRGPRVGGAGLVRDLQDLLTLAGSVHASWTTLRQTARERHDTALDTVCQDSDAETRRQMSWLETQLRHAAPQALSIPAQSLTELVASIPTRAQVGVVVDLLPGPAVRALVPFALALGAVATAGLLLSRTGRLSRAAAES